MKSTFTEICDPGHGWLKVNIKDLHALGLSVEDFSVCSYRSGSNCYLEEDCDAPIFHNAFLAKFGERPNIESRHVEYTAIRNMLSIRSGIYSQ